MTSDESRLLGEIHALADAVQRDTGRYCHVSAGHHHDGVVDVRVDIHISEPGEPHKFDRWDTAIQCLTITEVRDELAQWIASNRKQEEAA
ncbi:hypothetical protein ACFQH5_15825 [Halomonas salifodinae]|uniref:Uncharacterized protein n=1 Tax=Halomonas salifodinae TaxID=438745 RepID=A0ABW2F0P4_9GAMM